MNDHTLRRIWKYVREIRSLFRLAIPIMAGMVGQTLMGIADTVMVGKVGVVELAAASLVMNLFHLPMVFGVGLLSSVPVLTANAFGAKDPVQTGRVFRASIWLTSIVGIFLVILLMASRWVLPFLGQPEAVVGAGGTYLWYIALSLLPMLASFTGKQFCESLNRPWVPTLMMLGGVLLNWLFIYGNLGCPRMGLNGAGLATFLARLITVIVMVIWIFRSSEITQFRQWDGRESVDISVIRKLFNLGFPVSIQHLLEVGAFAFATLMMGWIDASAMAANQIAFTCASVTFMFSLSLGMASSIRVGQALGAGLKGRVRRIGWIGFALATLVMGMFACVFIFGGSPVAAFFVDSAEVRQLTVKLLLIAAFFQIFDGLQVTAISMLRGMQDVRLPAVVAVVAYWLVAVPLGYVVAFPLERGPVGIWVGLATGLGIAATLLVWRFYLKTRE